MRSRISGSGERYDSGLMIGMNVMKGSEVCMQIGNEVLCATLGAHCGGWRNLAKCFLTKARVYYILRSKIKCSFLYQKTVSTKRKWIVSEIYYTPGNKISLTTHFQALPGASMKNLDRYNSICTRSGVSKGTLRFRTRLAGVLYGK